MHTSSVWLKSIIWNHSFNHAAKASHHSLFHFIAPRLQNKKSKKENRGGYQGRYQSVLSVRGRWRAAAELIPLSISEAWVPTSEDEEKRGKIRKHWQLNACHKDLHRPGQLLFVSGYYCQNGQESDKLHFSILTVVPEEVPNLKRTGQVAYHAELNR